MATDEQKKPTQTTGASKTTKLPRAIQRSTNIEATKYYIFNETGNIMIASTIDTKQPLEEAVQRIFGEVSVFFAGMTRAITTTINPETGDFYSLYNYHALERVIGGSGLFVHVTEEDVVHKTNSFGADFSKELLEALLGLATGAGEMAFASAMLASVGKEGFRISGSSSTNESKAGNIVFVCEYLLGMPIVSAIVVYADCKQHVQQLSIGPCFQEEEVDTEWTLHKDTYLFVTPAFIRNYSGDLDSAKSDPNYIALVNWLRDLASPTGKQTPVVSGVNDANGAAVASGTALDPAVTYQVVGTGLPDQPQLKFASGSGAITVGTATETAISFTVKGKQAAAAVINVLDKNGTVVGSTQGSYTIK